MAQVRTRKRGKTYSYIFEAGQVNGKRKVVEKGGFNSKDEAYEAGVAAYTDWKHGSLGITSERIRLADYLDVWIKKMESRVIPSTINSYLSRITVIKQYLGDIVLQDIRPRDVDYFLQALFKLGRSYYTIHTYKAVLHNALQYAVYPAELISANPASAVKCPTNAPKNIIKRTIISNTAYKTILEQFPPGHKMRIPIVIAYHTGMRIGEILGLTWDNIDLDKGLVDVKLQNNYIRRKGTFITKPKTPASLRQIMIDSVMIKEFSDWKLKQAEYEEQGGGGYNYIYIDKDGLMCVQSKELPVPDNYKRINIVCTQPNGKPISKRNATSYFEKIFLNSHSFRHTHATTLIENSAIPKDIAARLGHSDVLITQNIYTHVTEQMKKSTVNILENILNADINSDADKMQTSVNKKES